MMGLRKDGPRGFNSTLPGGIIDIEGEVDKAFRFLTPSIKSFYIIGALRNSRIPEFANELQAEGYEAFADWYSPGPDADDFLREYSKARGLSYGECLDSYAAQHVFDFDKFHLDRCDAAVMLAPAGKSAHTELGYVIGRGKPAYMVFDEVPERYDVMVKFATKIFFSRKEFFQYLKQDKLNAGICVK